MGRQQTATAGAPVYLLLYILYTHITIWKYKVSEIGIKGQKYVG
jgi:hypothetical protein